MNPIKKKELIVYGIGKLAEYFAYVFRNDSEYEVIGFCIEKEYIQNNPDVSEDVMIFEDLLKKPPLNDTYLFIAVGNNIIRKRIYDKAKTAGQKFASYISSKATVWKDLEIGDNCVVGEGSVIQPFIKIGNNSILLGARIGHHSEIGKHVLISGSAIGGNVEIGDLSFLGMNSAVKQNISIGMKNIIGMGVSISSSTTEGAVFTSANPKKKKLNFEDISRTYLK